MPQILGMFQAKMREAPHHMRFFPSFLFFSFFPFLSLFLPFLPFSYPQWVSSLNAWLNSELLAWVEQVFFFSLSFLFSSPFSYPFLSCLFFPFFYSLLGKKGREGWLNLLTDVGQEGGQTVCWLMLLQVSFLSLLFLLPSPSSSLFYFISLNAFFSSLGAEPSVVYQNMFDKANNCQFLDRETTEIFLKNGNISFLFSPLFSFFSSSQVLIISFQQEFEEFVSVINPMEMPPQL